MEVDLIEREGVEVIVTEPDPGAREKTEPDFDEPVKAAS